MDRSVQVHFVRLSFGRHVAVWPCMLRMVRCVSIRFAPAGVARCDGLSYGGVWQLRFYDWRAGGDYLADARTSG